MSAVHEHPGGKENTACIGASIASISPQLSWCPEAGDLDAGVQTRRGFPHNCCCGHTVVEGKAMPEKPLQEVIAMMRQLNERGVHGLWIADARFIPARHSIGDAKEPERHSRRAPSSQALQAPLEGRRALAKAWGWV